MTVLTAACIQMRSTVSIDQNIEAMDELVRASGKDGALYIQTPEMTGLLQKNRKTLFETIKTQDEDQLVSHSAALAKELRVWLHIGSHAVLVGDELAANRAFLFSPDGEIITHYDKIHMFDVDLDNGESWRESKVYRSGSECRLVDCGNWKLGLGICYDVRFPALFRTQARAGAHILTSPAAFTRQTGRAHWHILMRARAIENGAFMLSAAQGGDHEDGRETFGHSIMVDPWGKVIAEINGEEPGYTVAELNLELVTQARQKVPNLKNEKPFEFDTVEALTPQNPEAAA